MVGFRAKDGTVPILLPPIPGFLQPPSSPHPLDFGMRNKKRYISGETEGDTHISTPTHI